jgi:hypothetical protein
LHLRQELAASGLEVEDQQQAMSVRCCQVGRDGRVRDRPGVQPVAARAGLRDRRDQLHGRLDGAAESCVGRGSPLDRRGRLIRRSGAEYAELGAARRAVVRDNPIRRQDAPPTSG